MRVRVEVNDQTHAKVESLIEMGFDFGYSSSCALVSLGGLGVSSYLSKEEILASLEAGVFPDVRNINLRNDELEVYLSVHNDSSVGVGGINDLLSSGWELGRKASYKKIKLSQIVSNIKVDHESLFLSGKDCPVKGVTMESPCKTQYVSINTARGKYSKTVHELYSFGWRFGYSTGQVKVSTKDVRKKLAKPNTTP